MIKNFFLIAFVFMFGGHISAQTMKKVWETGSTLSVPESVLFDDSVIYVSNINGKPDEKNGLGFIAKLNAEGKPITLKWIEGLNAPKGMGIEGNYLYVTDVDRIVKIDRKAGKIIQFIQVPGSRFLNDITICDGGKVAFSDMMDNTVYLLVNDKPELIVKSDSLDKVNGVWWGDGALFAGTADAIYKIDLATKTLKPFIRGTGGIDGLERVDANRMIISDWSGHVHLVSPNSKPVLVLDLTPMKLNAADIDFNPKTMMLYVPTFLGNSVIAYQLTE